MEVADTFPAVLRHLTHPDTPVSRGLDLQADPKVTEGEADFRRRAGEECSV